MSKQNNPVLDNTLLGKLCEKFDVSTEKLRLASLTKQKTFKELKKELKKIDTKSYKHMGYIYYLREKYQRNVLDVSKFKKEMPDMYKKYLKQITVNEQIVRRIDNAKNSK